MPKRSKESSHVSHRRTKATYTATYNVDAIAAFPQAVGTCGVQRAAIAQYELVEGRKNGRDGDVDIVEVIDDGRDMRWIGKIGVGVGVLDLEWLGGGLLGGVCADGMIRWMKMGDIEKDMVVVDKVQFGLGMVLSIGSENEDGCGSYGGNRCAALSGSKGDVGLVRVTERGGQVVWKKSDHGGFEAWCALYDGRRTASGESQGCVYSGGDDGWLRMWDGLGNKICGVKDAHGGVGVVSVACLREWGLVTGGYDDFIRGWDVRKMKGSVGEINVWGGAWRIVKMNRSGSECHALVPCMYDGFKVVDLSSWKVLDSYREHESIAYGAAWLDGLKKGTIITGSFYDKAVHVWRTEAFDDDNRP